MRGNKGEWSEAYTLIKLLADGKLFAGDGNLQKIPNIFYPIIKVLRSEDSRSIEYRRNDNIQIVDGVTGKVSISLSIDDFVKNAALLLKEIKSGKGGAFGIISIEHFMKSIKCKTLKAKSSKKSDITIVVHDLNTGQRPTLGFSIKSMLGGDSTLFNSSRATNFIYEIDEFHVGGDVIARINCISSRSKIRDRIHEIEKKGGKFKFIGIESKTFKLNLELIDSCMPEILAQIVLMYFKGEGTTLEEVTKNVAVLNPCNFDISEGHSFYDHKVKRFLVDIALGLASSKKWDGKYDATGGYIVVKEDGDLICYHIIRLNDFEDYLIKNTRLDTPSSSRHGFGIIYRKSSKELFNLNLQIRFN